MGFPYRNISQSTFWLLLHPKYLIYWLWVLKVTQKLTCSSFLFRNCTSLALEKEISRPGDMAYTNWTLLSDAASIKLVKFSENTHKKALNISQILHVFCHLLIFSISTFLKKKIFQEYYQSVKQPMGSDQD